jgi:hypothetical protein
MNPLLSPLLNEVHRRDVLAEAEAARKVAGPKPLRRNAVLAQATPRRHRRVLRHAGDLLVAVGTKLRLVPRCQGAPLEIGCCCL